jgi:hypothetical protein
MNDLGFIKPQVFVQAPASYFLLRSLSIGSRQDHQLIRDVQWTYIRRLLASSNRNNSGGFVRTLRDTLATISTFGLSRRIFVQAGRLSVKRREKVP